ncbi:MAG: UDPGP type 1 family protein [Planctomycetes bacterium]|nr:UDPGP type 1 family protein [Planctomycetota bacterium]
MIDESRSGVSPDEGAFRQVEARLHRYGQGHVLRWWSELGEEQRRSLLGQIQRIDFDQLLQLYKAYSRRGETASTAADDVRPPSSIIGLPRGRSEQAEWDRAVRRGWELLEAGRVAAVVVAGGQGTRLKFRHPKGLFPIGPVSGCSLFQLFAEQVLARSRRAGRPIPYLIMTSEATHEETVQFFESHDFFGLLRDNVRFFRQGQMPVVDAATGRLLLESKDRIATSPDGHGGLIAALARSGLLDWLAQHGIDLLFYHHVDNPCVKVCDPTFLGFHAMHDAEMSLKVVEKAYPEEKMGVVVERDGKTQIIEYIDLPPEMAGERDDRGRLRLWAGSPGIHVFSRFFLERLARQGHGLPFHAALKTVAYVDERGRRVEPAEPNAVKFERFIFDALPLAERVVVVETDRGQEFHPIKNCKQDDTTPDTPEAAREALSTNWRRWLLAVGAQCEDVVTVEISPLVALEPEDLRGIVQPGATCSEALLLRPDPAECRGFDHRSSEPGGRQGRG